MVVSSSFEHETKTGLANILAKSSGQIVPAVRDTPPAGLDLTTIRYVKVLRSLSETNKYGFIGGAGVIVIKTALTYKE